MGWSVQNSSVNIRKIALNVGENSEVKTATDRLNTMFMGNVNSLIHFKQIIMSCTRLS